MSSAFALVLATEAPSSTMSFTPIESTRNIGSVLRTSGKLRMSIYRAFQNGATARAAGVDRVVIFVVRHDEAARDLAMNQQAVDLLMDEPPKATQKQLHELHIRLNVPNKE
jgi:hypothetical protein